MSNSSIWPIDLTPSGAATPGQSGPGSDGNKGVLCILQSSSITGISLSDCLVSYPGHSLGEFYPTADMQSVYSAASVDWPKVKSNPKWLLVLWYMVRRHIVQCFTACDFKAA